MTEEKLTWRTERRKVSELKAYAKNPRSISKEQFQHLLDSFEEFNYVELIAIDTDNTIIAGHMRVRALKKLKRQSEVIEVRVPSRKLTEKEFEKYCIKSNLNTGQFDYDMLGNLFEPIELLDYGFTPEQLLGCGLDDDITEVAEEKAKVKKEKNCPHCGSPL